jgi:hypothetical protein
VRLKIVAVGLASIWLAPFGRADTAAAVGVGGSCGALPGYACDAGLICDYPTGSCGMLGGAGTCVLMPETCLRSAAQQVCGCNGTTYSSDCECIKTRRRKAHDGACK